MTTNATTTAAASETDPSLAVRDTAGRSENRTTSGRAGEIARLFRAVAKILPGREDAPAPPQKSRRRSGGETRRAQFVRLARRVTRVRQPAQAAGMALFWLTDTLDWLDLWHSAATTDELAGDPPAHEPNNHLSPSP